MCLLQHYLGDLGITQSPPGLGAESPQAQCWITTRLVGKFPPPHFGEKEVKKQLAQFLAVPCMCSCRSFPNNCWSSWS